MVLHQNSMCMKLFCLTSMVVRIISCTNSKGFSLSLKHVWDGQRGHAWVFVVIVHKARGMDFFCAC
ncbi:hypothetical protein KP509_01G121700 [Ceratopteris richardii]|uniref:Uncharacterized protein n=1 Tax=Ceratopteris richardii TaxID=49495 RepID=A0A8T2VTS0_CERRI|nr:hypothetical protein KP509_01G121700 [Ceratopteris richardii]